MALANLIINLIAKTEQFETGMRRAEKRIGGFDSRVKGIDRSLVSMLKGTGAFIGIGYSLKLVGDAFDESAKSGESFEKSLTKIISEHIPIVSAINKIALGISGVSRELVLLDRQIEVLGKLRTIQNTLSESIRLISVPKEQQPYEQAIINYEKNETAILEQRRKALKDLRELESSVDGKRARDLPPDYAARRDNLLNTIGLADTQIKNAERLLMLTIQQLDEEKKITEEKKRQKIEDEFLKVLDALELNLLREQQREYEQIQSLLEQTRSPLEAYVDNLEQITEWFDDNKINFEEFLKLEEYFFDRYKNATEKGFKYDIGQSQFQQIDTSNISIKGLSIGRSENLQQQMVTHLTSIDRKTEKQTVVQ